MFLLSFFANKSKKSGVFFLFCGCESFFLNLHAGFVSLQRETDPAPPKKNLTHLELGLSSVSFLHQVARGRAAARNGTRIVTSSPFLTLSPASSCSSTAGSPRRSVSVEHNKKQCSMQLQCEVPCRLCRRFRLVLLVFCQEGSRGRGGSGGRGFGVGWGGGLGWRGQGIFQLPCHILHYHMVPEGTSHNEGLS